MLVRLGAYPRVEDLKGGSLGKALALFENIRLGYYYIVLICQKRYEEFDIGGSFM